MLVILRVKVLKGVSMLVSNKMQNNNLQIVIDGK